MLKAKIESAVLDEALRIAVKLAPPLSGNVVIEAEKNKIQLLTIGDVSRCQINLPVISCDGQDAFAMPVTALNAAARGRSQIALSYDNDVLEIKSGRYEASLSTQDVIKEDAKPENKEIKPLKLKKAQAEWLKEAVRAVNLRPTVLLDSFMPVTVNMNKESTFVCCYDDQHIAYIDSQEMTGDMDITLPIGTMIAVLDTFGVADFEMFSDGSTLFIQNAMAKVEMALPDNENVATSEFLKERSKFASDAEGAKFKLSKDQIFGFLDNASAVLIAGQRMEIQCDIADSKCKLTIATAAGRVSDTIKAKSQKPISFRIDYEYFDEMLSKGVLTIKATEDFLFGTSENVNLIVALNQ